MKIDRLLGILTLLLQQDRMTASELAARFEVSRRTILRDVDALNRAGVPIVTARGNDGGIGIMEGYRVNRSVLNQEELQNLQAALKGLDSVAKTARFESLMLKLAPERKAMPAEADSVVIDLSSHYRASLSDKIACLRDAIARRVRVSFDYYAPAGESCREMEPYAVEYRWDAWYVFGWCLTRQAFRRFKLNRLWELRLTGESYQPRPVPPRQREAEDAFSEVGRMRIAFDPCVRFRLMEEYGPESFEESEGVLLFTLSYTRPEFAFRWVLSFGEHAEILHPPEARAALAERITKMAGKYGM